MAVGGFSEAGEVAPKPTNQMNVERAPRVRSPNLYAEVVARRVAAAMACGEADRFVPMQLLTYTHENNHLHKGRGQPSQVQEAPYPALGGLDFRSEMGKVIAASCKVRCRACYVW